MSAGISSLVEFCFFICRRLVYDNSLVPYFYIHQDEVCDLAKYRQAATTRRGGALMNGMC
jgi:hypothetical protein